MERATFGAGCFWGVEETFRKIDGVIETSVGYMGGEVDNPSYEAVCSGTTGHAEVVDVKFDPSKISYEELLEVFWKCHDPTTRNRQGPDVGTQYRSVVFVYGPAQEKAAVASKQRREDSGCHRSEIVTEITAASNFYRAEEYHQRYVEKRRRS